MSLTYLALRRCYLSFIRGWFISSPSVTGPFTLLIKVFAEDTYSGRSFVNVVHHTTSHGGCSGPFEFTSLLNSKDEVCIKVVFSVLLAGRVENRILGLIQCNINYRAVVCAVLQLLNRHRSSLCKPRVVKQYHDEAT